MKKWRGHNLHKHGLAYHPLHRKWRGIKDRILNPNCKGYKNYGGRGISICDKWKNDPKKFIEWCLENGWRKGLHIDRIDNDGDYGPNNCRFVRILLQSRN